MNKHRINGLGTALSLTGFLMLGACSAPPDFGDLVSDEARNAEFPTLVATDPIVAAHGGPVTQAPGSEALAQRAADLQARAGQVQNGDVIDPETLRRLEAARAAAEAQAAAR